MIFRTRDIVCQGSHKHLTRSHKDFRYALSLVQHKGFSQKDGVTGLSLCSVSKSHWALFATFCAVACSTYLGHSGRYLGHFLSAQQPRDRSANPPIDLAPPRPKASTMGDDDYTGTLLQALEHLNVSDPSVVQYFNNRQMLDARIPTAGRFTSKRIIGRLNQARRKALLAIHSDKTGEHRPEELHNVIGAWNMVRSLYPDLPVFDVEDSSDDEGEEEMVEEEVAAPAVDDDEEQHEEKEEDEVDAGEDGVNGEENERKPAAGPAAAAASLLLPPQDEDKRGRREASSSETKQWAEQETSPEYKKYIGLDVEYWGFWFKGRVMGLRIVEEKETKVERLCYHVVYEDGDKEDLAKGEMSELDIGPGQWSTRDNYIGATVWKEFPLKGKVLYFSGELDGEPAFACEFKNGGETYDRFLRLSEIPLPSPEEERTAAARPARRRRR